MNLNRMIMTLSLGGEYDNLGPYEINWKVEDGYAFVTVIEHTGKWWYRIFTARENFHYERGRILDSLENDEDPDYIYGYYEDMNGTDRELQKWVGLDRPEDRFQELFNRKGHYA